MSEACNMPANGCDLAALNAISAMCPADIDCPTSNNGSSYCCELFSLHAYDWGDNDDDESINLIWRDWRVSWYKYAGRGTYVNRHITPGEIVELLADIKKEFGL